MLATAPGWIPVLLRLRSDGGAAERHQLPDANRRSAWWMRKISLAEKEGLLLGGRGKYLISSGYIRRLSWQSTPELPIPPALPLSRTGAHPPNGKRRPEPARRRSTLSAAQENVCGSHSAICGKISSSAIITSIAPMNGTAPRITSDIDPSPRTLWIT